MPTVAVLAHKFLAIFAVYGLTCFIKEWFKNFDAGQYRREKSAEEASVETSGLVEPDYIPKRADRYTVCDLSDESGELVTLVGIAPFCRRARL